MENLFDQAPLDPLIVVVSRKEVDELNVEPALSTLRQIMASQPSAKTFMEKVDIAFHGYDQDPRELFEVDEIRAYVHKLDEQFPYWLFFLSKYHLGLQCLMFCFLLPHLTDKAKARLHPQQLEALLTNRWGPALFHMAAFAGLSEDQADAIAQRSMKYFIEGRFHEDSQE